MPEDPLTHYLKRRTRGAFSAVVDAHGERAIQAALR